MTRPRTEAEAKRLIQEHRAKGRPQPKPRGNPEAQVGFAIDERMAEAGFHVHDFSRKVFTAGVWVSAVTTGTPDRYYWHPDGRNIWVELKAPGGELRPEQAAFIAGHAHSPIEAVCWDSEAEAMAWLVAFD